MSHRVGDRDHAPATANRRSTRNGWPHRGHTEASARPPPHVVARRALEVPGRVIGEGSVDRVESPRRRSTVPTRAAHRGSAARSSPRSRAARRSARRSPRERLQAAERRAAATRRFDSPTPGMRSSSDVIVRTVRRFRWNVIAKRCASSRACCSMRSAGDRRDRRSGSERPSTKISSSRLARLADRKRTESELATAPPPPR